MPSQEKLSVIMNALNQQSSPTPIGELMQIIGPEFAEGTVRRWLDELVRQGLIIKTGCMSSSQYWVTGAQVPDELFSAQAFASVQTARAPLFKRIPVSYHEEWLSSYRPNKTFYLSEKMRQALSTQGQRQNDRDPAGTYAHKVYNRLVIDLSYHSCRLEGIGHSLLETQQLVLEGTPAKGRRETEDAMILNHKEAIRHIINTAPTSSIDFNEICTIHYLLADGLVERKYAGCVRNQGLRIDASTYIPHEDTHRLEQQLIKVCSLAKIIEDPFEQSFFILTHIAYLHAFIAFNKRTSRISANIPLIKNNLVPLVFSDIESADYTSAMICIFENNETLPLAELYYYSYIRNCQDYNESVTVPGFDRIRVQYREKRRNIIQQVILNHLINADIPLFVKQQSQSFIPAEDQEAFISSTLQDLDHLSLPQIANTGITPDQLHQWQSLKAQQGKVTDYLL